MAAPYSREKVPIKAGRTLLDWYRLKNGSSNLSGVRGFQMVTKAELKRHNTKEDCWVVLFGKVYNITPYLEYHPGGIGKLLVCKGRDATQLYVKTHAWVNHEQLLDKCLVGMLVPGGDDDDGGGGGGEDRATGEEADGSTTSCSTTAADEQPEMEELTAEQEAELTMFPAREGQQVRK